MPNHATREIRNVAVVGHGSSGKTTLVESLLEAAGAVVAAGSVEKGTATCDYEPEERAHQQSLWNAVASLDHDSAHVTFVDTPGYPDFLGRALPALAAVEVAAVVVDARSGIQTATRRMMEAAAARGLARLVVVNKIDAPDLDLEALLGSLREVFGSECLPVGLPAPGREQVVDCFFDPDPSAATDFSSVEEAQSQVVDQAVEMDEGLMETYLEQGEVSADDLHGAFRSALRAGHLVPVCFVSAATGAGVGLLLDVLARLMPSPADANPPAFSGPDGAAVEVEPDPGAGVVAQVFRVTIDPFVGKLSTFRIHSGTVTRIPSSTSTTAANPSRWDTCSGCRARSTWRSTKASRATSAPSRRWTRSATERCCTARAAPPRGPNPFPCPKRCTALPSRPGPAATSRSFPTPSRSSRPKTRASGSSTAPRPGKR